MKKIAIKFNLSQHKFTPKLLLYICFLLIFNQHVFGQPTNLIGIEYGGMLIPKVSSSGVDGSNYTIGIFSEIRLKDNWSVGYGFKYLKYGSHIHYQPMTGATGINEILVNKDQYRIHNVGIPLTVKYRVKHVSLFIGVQPEKALFSSNKNFTTQKVIPIEDIRSENYAQKDLRAFNVSALAGLEFRRNFGERVEFYTKPSAQYFTKSFYKRNGFDDVKWAFHINFGFNIILTEYAEQ